MQSILYYEGPTVAYICNGFLNLFYFDLQIFKKRRVYLDIKKTFNFVVVPPYIVLTHPV